MKRIGSTRSLAVSAFYRAVSGPYCGKSCWNSVNPAPTQADRWKSAVRLVKRDLTNEHLVRTDEGAVYARSVRRLAEHSGAEENLRGVGEATPKPKSTTVDSPLAAAQFVPPPEAPEVPGEGKEDATAEPEEDAEMLEEPLDTKTAPKMSTPSRGKKPHRNARECVCEEARDDEITEAANHAHLRNEDC